MPLPALAFRSAGEWLAALREGGVSSRELLELCLARVDALDGAIGAVVTLDVERARDAADAADAARRRGEAGGPLHGLPMTVKDTFETAGLRTTAGTPELAHHVPERDAVAVARLRAAGAVVFGKTNTPPWASDWQTTNPLFGTTRNPHDASRTPGGSSGGAAAALAAGLTPLELGSDIGGSIRVPAHWSGVCGHKPSHGLVPQRGHLPGPPGALAEADLNVVGPLARRVGDLALALDVLAGPLPEVARAWRLALPPPRGRALADFRVATWLDDPAFPVDAAMRDVLEKAAAGLRAEGAQVREARPDVDFVESFRTYLALLMPLQTRVQSDADFARLAAAGDGIPPDAAGWLVDSLRSVGLRHRDWLGAHERREWIRARWDAFFRDWDVLLCPVSLTTAIPHDERSFPERRVVVNGEERVALELLAWPALVGMALLPATVVPVGRAADGLPVGVQVVGPSLEDRTALAFAARVEEVLGGFAPPPAFA